MSEPLALTSPVRLLYETGDATEVLALSFNTDLAFFERFALGAARALGAVVTVLSDADYVTVDPRAVKWAGRTYLDARALSASGGTFHPKLLAIVGEDVATVAFGSGNVTTSGWHGNAELWAVLHTTADEVPQTLIDLAAWLEALPGALHLSGPGGSALARVAHQLHALPGERVPGPRLVSSLHEPILHQLPVGPVDELITYAPFYDPNATALAALIEHLAPKKIEVCVQSEQGYFDGAALTAAVAALDAHFTAIDEDRYHHGKLVEWRIGDSRYTLIGSPNITGAAMLRSMTSGGNCELGLIAPIDDTLRPAERDALSSETLRGIRNISPFEPRPGGPRLLEATLEPAGTRITLARALDAAARVQTGGESWTDIGMIPADNAVTVVAALMSVGTPIRVVDADGSASRVVLVADQLQVLRPTGAQRTRRDATEEDLFTDPERFLAFHRDVLALREYLTQRPSPPNPQPTGAPVTAKAPEFLTWEDRLRIYEDHLGGYMTHYGLALPRLAITHNPGYTIEVLDPKAAEPDISDGPDDEAPASPEPPSPPLDLNERDRQRYQRWCAELSDQAATLPPLARAIAVRIMLRAGGGRIWQTRSEWLQVTAKTVAALSASPAEFDDERTSLGSTAAAAVSILRSQIWDVYQETEDSQAVERALRAIRPLLADRTVGQIRQISEELEPIFGVAADPLNIYELAERLAKDDSIEEAVNVLADHGIDAHRTGDVIILEDAVTGDPNLKALEVLNHCHTAVRVAVRAHGASGLESLVVWEAPRLVVIDRNTKRIHGQLFELRGTMRPGDYPRHDRRLPTQHLVKEWWGAKPPESIRHLLTVPGLGTLFANGA